MRQYQMHTHPLSHSPLVYSPLHEVNLNQDFNIQPAVQTIQAPVATQPGQRRNLSLTREQMLEAQEMFRTANKVTRPEKALILGFMAGSR